MTDQTAATSVDYHERVPSNQDIERALTPVWENVLQQQQIPPTVGFTALGGDSLGARRMLSEVAEIFQVKVTLAEFFHVSTIEQLAVHIRGLMLVNARNGRAPTFAAIDEGAI
jgi:acyl carrier protein